MTVDDAARETFIRAHARLQAPPLTPELSLWLAAEATELWEASETFLEQENLPPPFWAFAWAGGQALARCLLDRPAIVRGKRVLDFGAGCGIAAIAAMSAGAAAATAADLDPFARIAAEMNAAANEVAVAGYVGDATALDLSDYDVVLAADVCYDRRQADPATQWLKSASENGVEVFLGDPGRMYLPSDLDSPIAEFDVPTPTALENAPITPTRIWHL